MDCNAATRDLFTFAMLKGINVLEMSGIGPTAMCGHMLKDYGASVTRILNPNAPFFDSLLGFGKTAISLNLQNSTDRNKMFDICKSADVLLSPYTQKCLDSLGFSTSILHKNNPRLVLCRISGFGEFDDHQPTREPEKDLYIRTSCDINYLAETGILWLFTGETCTRPVPPANLIADMAGGAFPAAFGIAVALYEREKTGSGNVVEVSVADGVSYMSTYFLASRQMQSSHFLSSSFTSIIWPCISKQCANLLDGGAPFYRTYATKDQKHIAVGAWEPHFYKKLVKGLGLSPNSTPQLDRDSWPRIAAIFEGIFASETRAFWLEQTELMRSACISPVWSPEEALEKRPDRSYRLVNFSLSPLSGVKNGNFSIKVPVPCPTITSFP